MKFFIRRIAGQVGHNDHCPTSLPWFAFGPEPMAEIHRLALAWEWRGADRATRIGMALATLLWPLLAAWRALEATWTDGRYVARTVGMPVWRQLLQQWTLALGRNSPASSYYKFRLFEPAARRKAFDFVHHHEIIVLLRELYRDLTPRLQDKVVFLEQCEKHDLPTVPTLAVAEHGAIAWTHGDALPHDDLIVKAAALYCGLGVQRWRYAAGRWSNGGGPVDRAALLEGLRTVAARDPYLLQRALRNHRDLLPLAGRGLCTVRVVTARHDGGFPPLLATLRMPTGEACVDNFAAHGVAAPVDLTEGTLGLAIRKDLSAGVLRAHPDSGAPIVGTRLPCWRETLAVCAHAHGCFPMYPFIGWDVAITDEGPRLLEANLIWCVDLVQMTHARLLGETVFPEVFLAVGCPR